MAENISISGNKIIKALKNAGISVREKGDFSNLSFSSVCYNSKDAAKGGLFFCKGDNFKTEYLLEAVLKGITGFISETEFEAEPAQLIVSDARLSLFIVSNEFYGNPEKKLCCVGITGTNGKTTTAQFITEIFKEACEHPQAFSSSTGIFDGCSEKENHLTTPEPPHFFECMNNAVKNGCTYFTMECSTHSEKWNRLGKLTFDIGVITNISDDHYSPYEHSGFEEYLSYKLAIIKRFKNAVINIDDSHADDFIKAAGNSERIIKCSLSAKAGADIYAEDIRREDMETLFTAVTPKWKQEIRVPLAGMFNVSNALCACAVGYLAGISPQKIAEGIGNVTANGRMEIFRKYGQVVVVDYAHNYESIRNALSELHTLFPNRKIQMAFGANGKNGIQRRKDIVRAAAPFCERFYITNDDPMNEKPEDIIAQVAANADKAGVPYEIIPDRKECIEKAIGNLTKNELLFITAKGNERYIKIGGGVVPYEGDINITQRMLEKKRTDL